MRQTVEAAQERGLLKSGEVDCPTNWGPDRANVGIIINLEELPESLKCEEGKRVVIVRYLQIE